MSRQRDGDRGVVLFGDRLAGALTCTRINCLLARNTALRDARYWLLHCEPASKPPDALRCLKRWESDGSARDCVFGSKVSSAQLLSLNRCATLVDQRPPRYSFGSCPMVGRTAQRRWQSVSINGDFLLLECDTTVGD